MRSLSPLPSARSSLLVMGLEHVGWRASISWQRWHASQHMLLPWFGTIISCARAQPRINHVQHAMYVERSWGTTQMSAECTSAGRSSRISIWNSFSHDICIYYGTILVTIVIVTTNIPNRAGTAHCELPSDFRHVVLFHASR